jgi:uncharacterized protein YqeY
MLARDKVKLEVLRGLSTAFMNQLVATNRTPQDILTDEEVLAVITRTAKQRKDAIEQFLKGGRQDLADEDMAQLKILETYLPKMMEKDEVVKIVKAVLAKSGITDPAKKGMLMKEAMNELKGKADGALVKVVIDELFV